ncbi:MAG: class II fructose-bisphosphate aldolase [Sulfuricella sp.]
MPHSSSSLMIRALHWLEAIVSAAERARTPVILSLAESHFDYFDFELAMPTVEAAAHHTSVPVAIHLDHGASLESAVRAIRPGCNGVMVDASHLPFGENLDTTRAVANPAVRVVIWKEVKACPW